MHKHPTWTFKIGSISVKTKNIRKFHENSGIISLLKVNSSYFAKKIQKIFEWTKIQLQFSKSGVFWLKKIFRKFLETSVIISSEIKKLPIIGVFRKYPRFWKLKLDFCPLKKSFEIFWPNIMNNLFINYLWPKFQEVCGIFFLAKIPPILKLEVGFFSEKL